MEKSLEQLAQQAREGDRDALEEIVCRIYGNIHGLSLRMLGYSSDAEDATQEILIKIITHLSTFRGESSFRTWMFRVAVNHLISVKHSRASKMNISFDIWEQLGYREDPSYDYRSLPDVEKMLLAEEVRIGCMQGMLQCLDGKKRIAYILGELFEMSSDEAALVLGTTPAVFRKRLSRGRERINAFMRRNCSLVKKENHCRCEKMIGPDIRDKWIDPKNLQFAGPHWKYKADRNVMDRLRELDEISRVVMLFRHFPEHEFNTDSIVAIAQKLIASKEFQILNHTGQ